MQGVCSAQTAGDCQGVRTLIQPPVRAGERKPNLQAVGSLLVFGLRLEGLTLKLENPSLVRPAAVTTTPPP